MATFTAPLFAGDTFLEDCLNGVASMGDRPQDGAPADSVTRYQTALSQLGFDVAVDGVWGQQTYAASLLFKTILDIRTAGGILDGYVGPKTMTAMEAIFGVAGYEDAAAASAFDLGTRTGDPIDQGGGITTVDYAAGVVVGVEYSGRFPVPGPLSGLWQSDGGASSPEGAPVAGPLDLAGAGVPGQVFSNAGIVAIDAATAATVPIDVLIEVDRGSVGAPNSGPTVDPSGTINVLPTQTGAILWKDEQTPVAIPTPVADTWTNDTAAGNTPGAPVALAFAIPGATVFPFVNTNLALSDNGVVTRAAAVSGSLDRFTLPSDQGRHFQAAVDGNDGRLLVGGDAFFASLANDLAAVGANGFVYLASWNCQIDLPCFPGGRTLRAELSRLTALGAEAKMQLWAAQPVTNAVPRSPALLIAAAIIDANYVKPNTNNPVAVNAVNGLPNSFAFLDNNVASFGSHHQKVVIVGTGSDLVAYVGGIEFTDDRIASVSKGAPLFDVSVRLTGPATALVLKTFAERWASHPDGVANPLNHATFSPAATSVGSQRIQVGHTYPKGLPFSVAIRTASELAANAILNARTYFYIEDQYFVGDPRMVLAIQGALARGVTGIAVIAAEDSVEDLPDVGFRRRAFISSVATAPGTFLTFEAVGDDGTSTGPRAYVHSKLILVDDEIMVVGSMNSSRRSWNHDSEIVAAIVDQNGPGGVGPGSPGFAKAARMDIWARHLKPTALPAVPVPIDPLPAALAAWSAAVTTPGLSVRAYPPAGSSPKRLGQPTVNLPAGVIDAVWNTLIDPT